jgi:hypothetical protein
LRKCLGLSFAVIKRELHFNVNCMNKITQTSGIFFVLKSFYLVTVDMNWISCTGDQLTTSNCWLLLNNLCGLRQTCFTRYLLVKAF